MCSLRHTCIDLWWYTAIFGNVVVILTGSEMTRSLATYHRFAIFWHLGIAIMTTFAAMFNAVHDIDAGAVACQYICRTLFAALTAATELIAVALCKDDAATLVGVLCAIACFGVNMVTLNALLDFALAVRACSRLPAGDAIGAHKSLFATVMDGVIDTSVIFGMHVFLARG